MMMMLGGQGQGWTIVRGRADTGEDGHGVVVVVVVVGARWAAARRMHRNTAPQHPAATDEGAIAQCSNPWGPGPATSAQGTGPSRLYPPTAVVQEHAASLPVRATRRKGPLGQLTRRWVGFCAVCARVVNRNTPGATGCHCRAIYTKAKPSPRPSRMPIPSLPSPRRVIANCHRPLLFADSR
jgi:hypothetical protein